MLDRAGPQGSRHLTLYQPHLLPLLGFREVDRGPAVAKPLSRFCPSPYCALVPGVCGDSALPTGRSQGLGEDRGHAQKRGKSGLNSGKVHS